MRKTTNTVLRLILATLIALVLLPGRTLFAQEKGERGYIEVGIRQLFGDHASSKFSEYRHLSSGFYLQKFDLHLKELAGGKFFFNYQTRKTIESDQSHLVDAGEIRKFRVQLRWDQIPHYFSNTAKSLYVQTGPGTFSIPAAIKNALQTTPAQVTSFLDGAQLLNPTISRRAGSGALTITPTPEWTVQLNYSREMQTGTRPFGTTFYFTNTLELPEPIDYRTHQVNVGAEYSKNGSGIQVGFASSIFNNKISTLIWDNPFRATDLLNGPAATGRLDLYPDNRAGNVSIAGAINLSKTSRLMASIVPGWMRQNDAFLPFTTNSTVANLPQLPATSLNGSKNTLAMNYTFTTSVVPALPFTLRYRSYDYSNDTPSLVFSDYIRTDVAVEGAARRSLPFGFNRKNLDANLSYVFLKKSALKFGYEWERYDRVHRDVEVTDEHTVGASLDFNPRKWLMFRTSYKHSNRDPNDYEANEEGFPTGEAMGQNPALRKFDEASRIRNRAEALVQIEPTETLAFSASYGTTQDDYRKSLYGLLKDINYNFSLDVTYTPHPNITLFADYTKENAKLNQRSRQRTPASPTAPANDSLNNDWESDIRDVSHTWGAGVVGSAFKSRVTFESYYSLCAANGLTHTRALGLATIPGFVVTSAQNYPDTLNRFHQLVGSIRFKFGDLYPKIEYRFEKYGRNDYQVGVMTPYMGLVDPGLNNSIFLGANVPGYRAHVVSVSLGYRF